MSRLRRGFLVALLAVLGIVVAAGITWGTSQLVRQRIGLASEPLTAGRRLLAPALRRPTRAAGRPSGTSSSSRTRTTLSQPAPSTPTTPPAAEPRSPSTSRSTPASTGEGAQQTASPSQPTGGDGADSSARRDD